MSDGVDEAGPARDSRWARVRRLIGRVMTTTSADERGIDDRGAIERLRAAGVDPLLRHDVTHELIFPAPGAAQMSVELLARPGRHLSAQPAPDGGEWLVSAVIDQTLTAEDVARLREELETVAEGLDGQYVGWRVPASDMRMSDRGRATSA